MRVGPTRGLELWAGLRWASTRLGCHNNGAHEAHVHEASPRRGITSVRRPSIIIACVLYINCPTTAPLHRCTDHVALLDVDRLWPNLPFLPFHGLLWQKNLGLSHCLSSPSRSGTIKPNAPFQDMDFAQEAQ